METRRLFLIGVLIFIVMTLWQKWQQDYPAQATMPAHTAQEAHTDQHLLPDAPDAHTASTPMPDNAEARPAAQKLIHVTTDVLNVDIDPATGDIVHAALLRYPVSLEEKDKPFLLLNNIPALRYIAKNTILVKSAQAGLRDVPLEYHAAQDHYTLASGQKNLEVQLSARTPEGLRVQKTFTFTRADYLIATRVTLSNDTDAAWAGYVNMQIVRTAPEEDKSSLFHIGTYSGASYGNPADSKYNKVSYSDIAKNNLNKNVQGGWIAMQQHYFLTAWVPGATDKNLFYTRQSGDTYLIGSIGHMLQLAPKQQTDVAAGLYVGPEDAERLKAIAPGLDLTIDYGILWFLSSLLFSVMTGIYHLIGNWGWSIVLVTVLIKLAFYRLSAKSYRSMASMRTLQPKLLALRERYGDDKAKLSQATMALYREEKVNPLGGCLPILIQIPVFIALYWVLLESVALRQAPFIFWIHDLASADPYHVLPVIMGLTMFIQQRLNPAPPDPAQARVMMFLPVLFTGLFWSFPAGLVLYWTVNNALSILQQWYITRHYTAEKPKKPVKTLISKK